MATHSSIFLRASAWLRSLAGYSPWGHIESDLTEQIRTAQHNFGESEVIKVKVNIVHCKEVLLSFFLSFFFLSDNV